MSEAEWNDRWKSWSAQFGCLRRDLRNLRKILADEYEHSDSAPPGE